MADFWESDPVATSPAQDGGDWWKNDTVADAQPQDDSFTGQLTSGHYLDALKTGLGNVMRFPGKVALSAGATQHGQFYWPSDEEVETPLLPKRTVQDFITKGLDDPLGPRRPEDAMTGALRGVGNVVSGATSPENIALLGLAPEGKIAQRLIAGTFLGQSLLGTPEQWEAFKSASTAAEKTRIGVEMGLGLALPAAGLAHSFKGRGEVPSLTQQEVPVVAELPKTTQEAARAGVQSETATVPQTQPQIAENQVGFENKEYPNPPVEVPPRPNPASPSQPSQQPNEPGITAAIAEIQRRNAPAERQSAQTEAVAPSQTSETETSGQQSASSTNEESVSSGNKPVPETPPSSQPESIPTSTRNATTSEPGDLAAQVERNRREGITLRVDKDGNVIQSPSEPVGVAERYANAEMPDTVQPGTREDAAHWREKGRDYINQGGDPRMPIRAAQAGHVSPRNVGIVSAEHERLTQLKRQAADALEQFPTNPELQKNFKEASDAWQSWRREMQPVLTRAGESLAAAIGEHPVDLATFDGLHTEAMKLNGGEPLTPGQKAGLMKRAGLTKRAKVAESKAVDRLQQEIDRTLPKRKVPTEEEMAAEVEKLSKELTPCQ